MSNNHTPPPIVQSVHNMYWTRGSMSTYKAGWQGNVSDMDLTQTHTTAKSRQNVSGSNTAFLANFTRRDIRTLTVPELWYCDGLGFVTRKLVCIAKRRGGRLSDLVASR